VSRYGKLIGAGLGWAFGGPIGAVIGLGLGWMFDSANQADVERGYNNTTTGDFLVSMLVLFASVMKADGQIMRSELDYVKTFLIQKFGRDTATDALKMLRDLIKQNIPIQDVSFQIRDRLDYHSRLELLHLLYGVAQSDGHLHEAEAQILNQIGYYLGISNSDHQSIRNMFGHTNDTHYKILGIDKNASAEEIKKAYRKLAVEFHPDKVAYLGEDIRKDAEVKFRKINEAYDKLKKEKGIV
jgi:DnaJ like chaperone protein